MEKQAVAVLNNCEKAKLLAEELGLICVETDDYSAFDLLLKYDNDNLYLNSCDMSLSGDFSQTAKRIKPQNLKNEGLVRACKIKNSADFRVVDATAGFGEDSFLLAAAGFSVDMFEYNPIIAKLLENAMQRGEIEGYSSIISRMTLKCTDSICALKSLNFTPDIVYLDPMFPERRKNSLIKKKFQILQKLECPCDNETELLSAAIEAKPAKIVIKRPSNAPLFAGRKPSYTINGSTIRYDCIVLR